MPATEEIKVRILAAQDALAVFLMFVLVKGHWPSSKGTKLGADIPAFLANTIGMDYAPFDLANRVASFPLVKLDPSFLKAIPYEKFGTAFVTRFFMGGAGYRLLAAFMKYPALAKSSAHNDILGWIYERLTEEVSWKILPLTRPKGLVALGSLNTALISLMYEVYTDQQRAELVKKGPCLRCQILERRLINRTKTGRESDPEKSVNGMSIWPRIMAGNWKSEPIFDANVTRMESK